MFWKKSLPAESDFPAGTEFYILEWTVPLSKEPDKNRETVSYFNWYGGRPKTFPPEMLKIDNNWKADSFSQWLELVKKSTK